MSADVQIRSRPDGKAGSEPVTVSPQQVTDPTILDSVAGFIHEVVPNTYNVPCDSKDQIQWARFEQLDCDDYPQDVETENFIPSPLVLVLGYSTGIQVWSVPATGEAAQLLSWKHSAVKVLKILPNPAKVRAVHAPPAIDEHADARPLMALCDNATPGGAPFCSLSFLSLRSGDQVKLIRFQIPIVDVVANRASVAVAFAERIAVFDAFTLEDKLVVTTCYLSPGVSANPVALGQRWLAYAENKLIPARRSSGGNEGEGVQSYTATVLHAAKSLGRGLREFGETVANSLTGTAPYKPTPNSQPHATSGGGGSVLQKGVVTILDLEHEKPTSADSAESSVVCHFVAHTEAVVHVAFDPSGALLLTADRRGHDFHVFRVQPHPGGPALAAVHHLYVLHRGDTSARVQDAAFSPDSRWAAVSTLRGTTHVFPVTPYGGPVGVRTHATPYVVNRMSRFHRSAGLTAEGRSDSPVSLFEAPVNSNLPYHNPRLPPYPQPAVVGPLAQIRQPVYIQPSTSSSLPRTVSGRQRLGSSSEDNVQDVLRVRAKFAPPRAWIAGPPGCSASPRDASSAAAGHGKQAARPVESLFVVSCHGSLIQYDLEPRHVSNVPKEKVCDDTPIELHVKAKAQWVLQRYPNAKDILLPLSADALNQINLDRSCPKPKPDHNDDKWLSQVEIVTHAGPHRRLWMGPQFTFKTYTTTAGNVLESKAIDVRRSKPVNMPLTGSYPVLIEAGSVGSCEPSPKLLDAYHRHFDDTGCSELQLKEDLADAMLESPGAREGGRRRALATSPQPQPHLRHRDKVVNPLGTVVTLPPAPDDESLSSVTIDEAVIHENRDEALFRPVVASRAVVFAEPTNVRTKVSYSSLHINSKKFYVPEQQPEEPAERKVGKSSIEKSDSLSEVDSGIERESPRSRTADENLIELSTTPPEDDDSRISTSKKERPRPKNIKYPNTENQKDFASSSEENNASDEKIVPKKPRKPKTKLGIRIATVTPTPTEEILDLTPLGKPLWSSIAASKPIIKDPLISPLKNESVLFQFESTKENEQEKEDNTDNKDVVETMDLLKIDKSSDEEKPDTNGSSQTETTTESDDSSKVVVEAVAMDTEEDNCQQESQKMASSTVVSKSTSKKKSKKKKR